MKNLWFLFELLWGGPKHFGLFCLGINAGGAQEITN